MRITTLSEIKEIFRNHNKRKGYNYGSHAKDDLSAIIVFKQENWDRQYTEKERSYRVTNESGKAFFEGMSGNSIYGDCLDGKDLGVRLDAYNWKIEYCYLEN